MIIDEAQDLAPLQWRMVKEVLVPNSKEIYYAGDDDQAIYTWMGVKLEDFLKASDKKTILNKSYRVPSAVHEFSQNLIKKVSTRQLKEWQPTKKDGTITWHRDILDVDLTSGEWLILARTNYITNKVCTRLKEEGYLYWREGTGWSISPNVLNGIEVWLKLCKNQNLSIAELKNFVKLLNPDIITKSGRKRFSHLDPEQTYSLEDIIESCSLSVTHETPWQKVLKVSEQETAYIMSVRRRGERILTGTPRIRISTIHKAKGGEADNVALLLDSTKACVESLDQDSEIRTFYVGATRAKKTLHLIERRILLTNKDREYFLKEAEKLINGQRAKEYGPAKKNHQRIADIWTILLDKKLNDRITPEEVVACMIGVKVARLAEDISKDDSWTDVIGYAALGGEIINDKT